MQCANTFSIFTWTDKCRKKCSVHKKYGIVAVFSSIRSVSRYPCIVSGSWRPNAAHSHNIYAFCVNYWRTCCWRFPRFCRRVGARVSSTPPNNIKLCIGAALAAHRLIWMMWCVDCSCVWDRRNLTCSFGISQRQWIVRRWEIRLNPIRSHTSQLFSGSR